MARVFWFRRDLRLQDNLGLNKAITEAASEALTGVLPVYCVDLEAFNELRGIRQHSLIASLDALGASLDRNLTIRHEPAEVGIVAAALRINARVVHATEAFDPKGVCEQNLVRAALAKHDIELSLCDSYYATKPGTIRKPDATAYRVYTPFFKAWDLESYPKPFSLPLETKWLFFEDFCHGKPVATESAPFEIKAGEEFALRTWNRFKKRALENYDELRNRADLSGTSHLSHALAHGEIHPRTLLAELGSSKGEVVFKKEIAWREFYADVLWHNPESLTEYLEPRFARMRYDTGALAESRLRAWQEGKTGYPLVDAGMRQLLAEGWMHNRVRMVVASFLVKDLHLEWQQGAQWFEALLSDFDPASNAHGWQWTAGCGTDASPYFRVFNPILQGKKFDPEGNYVRKYVAELRHIETGSVHEPWLLIDGFAHGYPEPIVDHFEERNEALARLEELKAL
jgi:deoxyribodipyrimidine photo-lyase